MTIVCVMTIQNELHSHECTRDERPRIVSADSADPSQRRWFECFRRVYRRAASTPSNSIPAFFSEPSCQSLLGLCPAQTNSTLFPIFAAGVILTFRPSLLRHSLMMQMIFAGSSNKDKGMPIRATSACETNVLRSFRESFRA